MPYGWPRMASQMHFSCPFHCKMMIFPSGKTDILLLFWIYLQHQIWSTKGSAYILDTNLAGCKHICNFCRGWRKNRYAEVDQSFSELLQLLIMCNAYCHWEGYVSLATIKYIVKVPEEFLVNNDFSPLKLIFFLN